VLSEVMERLTPRRSDFLATMTNFLAKELRSDQYANLEQARHNTEERIPLARIFVDLPIGTQTIQELFDHPRKEKRDIELIALLMDTASDPLDPASILQTELPTEDRPIRSQDPQPGRYVLA
jgi:hypothetical protein